MSVRVARRARWREALWPIGDQRADEMDLIRGIDAVHGHPVIDRSFPLAEIVDAFRLQESGGHFGKIVVEF